MKPIISTLLFTLFLVLAHPIFAQHKSITKLPKVSIADFSTTSPVIDSNANAVVLFDIGSSEFEGNNDGDFTLIYKRTKRIWLRNKNAFDAATVKVPIYIGSTYSDEERFEDFEATTYNLEQGQIIDTKLDKASFFKEKYNRTRTIIKFTFSNIKEGSIIEYKYTLKSPFFKSRLRSW